MKMGVRFLVIFILFILYLQSFECIECHPKCHCDKVNVVCKNANLTDQTLPLDSWVPKTVKNIRITGNNIIILPNYMFGNCSKNTSKQYLNLEKLDLSGNRIHTIHGMTFHCIPNLKELNLADNNLVIHRHTGLFSPLEKLETLNLTNGFHDRFYNRVHVDKLAWVLYDCRLESLKHLYLAENEFQVLTKDAARSLCTLKNLIHLDLSRNNLTDPVFYHCRDPYADFEFAHLKYLDFSNNFINIVPKEMTNIFDAIESNPVHTTGLTINYQHNLWNCDCKLQDFVQWIKTTNVTIHNARKLYCHDGQHMNKKLWDLNSSALVCETLQSPDSLKAGFGALSTLLISISLFACLIAAIAIIYVKRKKVKPYWKRATNAFRNAFLKRNSQFDYSSLSTIAVVDRQV